MEIVLFAPTLFSIYCQLVPIVEHYCTRYESRRSGIIAFVIGYAMLANSFILEAIKSKNHQEKQTSILRATFWYFIGGILGWPFALALGLPVGFYTIYQSVVIGNLPLTALFRVLSVLLTVVVPIMIIDSFSTRKYCLFRLTLYCTTYLEAKGRT